MARKLNFTEKDLFDLIAPIHLYQQADVCLQHEAKTAFKNLKKVRENDLVKFFFAKDNDSLYKRNVEDVDAQIFWSIYNQLFKGIVTTRFPHFKSSFDSYGAKCFMVDGYRYLCGDAYDCFPFYLDASALEERLMDLAKEVA